jgi:DNA-binding MarR family transcriptional regulator
MNAKNNNEAVYWLLMQVIFQAKYQIHEIAEKHGLTVMQFNTLTMLKDDHPLAMKALSDYFMCDASNVTGLADRLESRGLVIRQDHPSDRRIKLIALTQKGASLRDTLIRETITAEARRLNPVLDEAERKTLHDLLEKVVDAKSVIEP